MDLVLGLMVVVDMVAVQLVVVDLWAFEQGTEVFVVFQAEEVNQELFVQMAMNYFQVALLGHQLEVQGLHMAAQ